MPGDRMPGSLASTQRCHVPVPRQHPLLRDSKSMEKDQLISMIHFIVKREEEEYNSTRSGKPRAEGYG